MIENVNRILLAAALGALMVTAQAADTKADAAKAGPATAPIIRATTNTIITYSGGVPANIVGSFDAADSTFNRPVTCAALSGVGTAAPFDTVTFNNTTAATATVNFRIGPQGSPAGACGDTTDTFLVAYNGPFNPAAPLTNCLAVNDDTAAAADRCSTLNGVSVPAGATRIFVVTGFNNAATANGLFPYEISFSGTTPVSLQAFSVD